MFFWPSCTLVRGQTERRRVQRRQGPRSLGRPLSLSADWTEELELERGLRGRGPGEGSEGSWEFLEGYGAGSEDRLRGGSQPLCCSARRPSLAHAPACGLQDVFSGEWRPGPGLLRGGGNDFNRKNLSLNTSGVNPNWVRRPQSGVKLSYWSCSTLVHQIFSRLAVEMQAVSNCSH